MEIKTNELNKNKNISSGRVSAMKLDSDSQAMIFQMFTGGLYSDPVGTVIREITSNCFDSHVEAEVDSKKVPVIVRLGKDLSGHHMSFIDKGMGMSPDRVINIYGTYFKSTKRSSNNQIGGFGLGGKTPLAYAESFYVITVSSKENEISFCRKSIETAYDDLNLTNKKIKVLEAERETNIPVAEKDTIDQDIIVLKEKVSEFEADVDYFLERLDSSSKITTKNVKYVYDIFEDNTKPANELLSLEGTEEGFGTEVKIPVKESDLYEFERKTLRQLYYFENIIFEGFSNDYVTNDYKIVRGKNFMYRGDDFENKIHVCYGRVAYPLNYETIGFSPNDYSIPIAIRLEIGELEGTGVTPSRESLKYTNQNIKIIKNKIDAALSELKEMLAKQHENVETLEEYYFAISNISTLRISDDDEIFLGDVIKVGDITLPKFKYNEFSIPNADNMFDSMYNVHLYGKKPPRSRYSRSNAWDMKYSTMDSHEDIYYNDKEFDRSVIKQSYLKHISNNDRFYIITPYFITEEMCFNLKVKLGVIVRKGSGIYAHYDDPKTYEYVLNKRKATRLVNELLADFHELVGKKATNRYADVEVSQDFIDFRKEKRINKGVLKEGIPLKSYNKSYTSASQRHNFERLVNFRGRIYYGFLSDSHSLEHCSSVMNAFSCQSHIRNSDHLNLHDSGILIVGISRANEKYMKMLGRKAMHVDYFYQTFVYRKLDDILQSRHIDLVNDIYSNKINDVLKNVNVMQHVDIDIYKAVKNINNYMNNIDKYLHQNISADLLEDKLNTKISNQVDIKNTPIADDVKLLISATEKSSKRLDWIQLPYNLDINNETHKELLFMLDMIIEK